MLIQLTTQKEIRKNSLILVGGSGDPIEKFQPFANILSSNLTEYTIVTFTLSQHSNDSDLLKIQSRELTEVIDQLMSEFSFQKLDLWCTSMGAYAAIKALQDDKYKNSFGTIIFFDPADYYLEARISDADKAGTWSGPQDYSPIAPTISMELQNTDSSSLIHVVHLVLRNYSEDGYIASVYQDRGIDHESEFPRLNTAMVESFYKYIPSQNKGEYIEVADVPHGFIRDGNIELNLQRIANVTQSLLD